MEPPLGLDYLASLQNAPISPSEARIAQAWILTAEQESARMDQEIRDIESRRLDLHRSLQIYREAVAPHKTLLVDILREIFKFCGGDSDLNEIADLRSNNVPLALCGVCSGWRAVALATHELWSAVRVSFPYGRNPAPLVDALELWLSRTGAHPVTLYIATMAGLAHESPDFGRVDQLIVEYSRQLRSVSVHGHGLPLRSNIFATTPLSFDQLEMLVLRIRCIDNDTPVSPHAAAVVAPNLRSLILDAAKDAAAPTLTWFQFPWSTLTSLTLLRGILY
ncbi:hypothetical protein C8R46DRAFT_996751 [Mycena filopes]|nr:hypothetical protein C8R46DRAFT_996751 [Mycena filopes]